MLSRIREQALQKLNLQKLRSKIPSSKHHLFTPYTPEGKQFIEMYNSADKVGIQKRLSQHFSISIPTVYRIRKNLKLPDFHDKKNHPGKINLMKRIRKLYINKERSTIQIGQILRISSEKVRYMLLKMRVTLRPSHVTNPSYYKTRQTKFTPYQLLQQIRNLYLYEHLPILHISNRLGISEESVRTKLKAMKIHKPRKLDYSTLTKANCQWCNTLFPQYISKGPKTQRYCSPRCSNKAKDYRRIIKDRISHEKRIKSMEDSLKNTWKDKFEEIKDKILSVKPARTQKIQLNNSLHCKQTYQEA